MHRKRIRRKRMMWLLLAVTGFSVLMMLCIYLDSREWVAPREDTKVEAGAEQQPESEPVTEPTDSVLQTEAAPTQPPQLASQPHFTIVDDDGKEEVYTVLMPLLNERGIAFSTSVITSRLNKNGMLSVEQLREIVAAGNKVMCHGKSHVNLKTKVTTYEERYEEIVGAKQVLEDLGFEVDTMVYPYGGYNDEVLEITRNAYRYGLATAGETSHGQQRYNPTPVDPYTIARVNIGSYYSGETAEERAQILEDAKANVDVCIENNYLCVIMTQIGDADVDGIAQLVELIDYIESKGYRIDDFDTAVAEHIQTSEE